MRSTTLHHYVPVRFQFRRKRLNRKGYYLHVYVGFDDGLTLSVVVSPYRADFVIVILEKSQCTVFDSCLTTYADIIWLHHLRYR